MLDYWKFWLKNRKGDLELDQLGRLVIALFLLVIIIVIITVVIRGELNNQGQELKNVFSVFD